jgi:hypothetical protein
MARVIATRLCVAPHCGSFDVRSSNPSDHMVGRLIRSGPGYIIQGGQYTLTADPPCPGAWTVEATINP